MKKLIEKMSTALNVRMESYVPDSFIFAVILTLVVYIMGILHRGERPFSNDQLLVRWFLEFLNFLYADAVNLGYRVLDSDHSCLAKNSWLFWVVFPSPPFPRSFLQP